MFDTSVGTEEEGTNYKYILTRRIMARTLLVGAEIACPTTKQFGY